MSDGGVLEVVREGHLLTLQLESYLNECCSVEYCRTTIHGILAAWEKLMFMGNPILDPKAEQYSAPPVELESPEVSDNMTLKHPFVCQEEQEQKLPKKRKAHLPTWTGHFRACSPSAGADDGFNWRKYGQKEILGFKEPRCYYRCSHRFTQKCQATKQIQRSEHDPSLYDVKYHGTHSCVKTRKRSSTRTAADTMPANPHFDINILQSLKTGLRVQTESLPGSDQEAPSTSASYLTPSFSTPSPLEEVFSGSFSSFSSFVSPTEMSADEPGHYFWEEPLLEGNESQGMEVAAPFAVPPGTISPSAGDARVELVGDVLFELDADFPDFWHELV